MRSNVLFFTMGLMRVNLYFHMLTDLCDGTLDLYSSSVSVQVLCTLLSNKNLNLTALQLLDVPQRQDTGAGPGTPCTAPESLLNPMDWRPQVTLRIQPILAS